MRNALCTFVVFSVFGSALAQPADRAEALAALTSPAQLERAQGVVTLAGSGEMRDVPALLTRLREDDAPVVRGLAEQAIWAIWSRSGDAAVDALFAQGLEAMQAGELRSAIGTFTRIVKRKPDFAEGWNKRATAYFLAGDYERSLADCDEVMRRNPLHFGALAGYGQIYLRLGQYEKSLDYLRRALHVNPNMEGVRALIEEIEARVRAGRKTI